MLQVDLIELMRLTALQHFSEIFEALPFDRIETFFGKNVGHDRFEDGFAWIVAQLCVRFFHFFVVREPNEIGVFFHNINNNSMMMISMMTVVFSNFGIDSH